MEPHEDARAHVPEPQSVVKLDAKGLSAMAHPVRLELIGLLRKHGPSTATQLARRTGLNSGATSYHLRQLAAAGFIEEDSERGNARERWWRSRYQSTWFTDQALVDQEPEASSAYLQSVAAAYAVQTQRAVNELLAMPFEWRRLFSMGDSTLWLTTEETESMEEELAAVIARYRRYSEQARASGPAGAARVAVITHVLPDPEDAESEDGEPGSEPGSEPGGVAPDGTGR
jgi:DNA-binding transcriptional ArsR family regulator